MRFNLKIAVVIVIAILLISTGYYIFFIREKDAEAPTIDSITGDISAEQGESIDISVSFSDNENVTSAIIYYKTEDSDTWSNSSIINGMFNIYIPKNSPKDWYYYVVIDDKAGNGPVGDPSTDGSIYYAIEVADENDDDEEFVHTVFIEEGTQTDCTYCPWAADALHELYDSGKYDFYYIAMIDDENNIAKTRLVDEYNIEGYPTIFVDGGYRVYRGGLYKGESPKQIYETYIQEALSRDVPKIKISVDSIFDNNTGELSANVTIENYEKSDYSGNLRLYLTEKISRWNDYNGSKCHFGFLDYIINRAVSIDKNSEKDFSETYDATDLDPANLMIVAVIFNSESHQGYAKPPEEHPFDAYYADACDATEVIKGGNLPPEVGITSPQFGKIYFNDNILFSRILDKLHISRLNKTYMFGWKKIITVDAKDDSQIEKVEFYIDDELMETIEEAPYEFTFNKLGIIKKGILPKQHTIKVIAYDDTGKTSSDSIEIHSRI